MPETIFVYGTLLRGAADHLMAAFLKQKSSFVGKGVMPGRMYKVQFFPAVVEDDTGGFKVYGEVYRMHDSAAVFTVLDEYEAFLPDDPAQSLFVRKIKPIQTAEGPLDCWVYLYNQPIGEYVQIRSGDFLRSEWEHRED
ncbi:MAG: gamma-glutamylcyclotransferase [Bacteroidia bacterium]